MSFNQELYDYLKRHFIYHAEIRMYNFVDIDDYVVFSNTIYRDRTITFYKEEINYPFLKSFCDATSETDFGKTLQEVFDALPTAMKREREIELLLSWAS